MIPLSRYAAIDCEMVGCRLSQALARVAIVDHVGAILYHSYVYQHPDNVVDWRSDSSGIHPGDLDGAPTFEQVQIAVRKLLADKIIVGHALFNDLAALGYRHTYDDVRDTALFYPLRRLAGVKHEGQYPSLRTLSLQVLGREIQTGEHNPVEDARATMDVFLTVRGEYEAGLAAGDEVIAGVPSTFAKWYW